MSISARIVLAVVGLALLVPLAAMGLQSDGQLERFHNRVLTTWPESRTFRRNPARYFESANAWFADRAYPIIAATYLKNGLAYSMLGTSPAPNVTVSRDGFVFLNGTEADAVDDLIRGACVDAAEASVVPRLQAAVDRIGRFARARGYPIDVVLIPTIPTLYGDRLPRSVPPRYREACGARARGDRPLTRVHSAPGTRFTDPFEAMKAHRDDEAFFPLGNFHPDGWSVELVRDAYLAAVGENAPTGETLRRTMGPSEILEDHGVSADFPIYRVSGDAIPIDEAVSGRLRSALAGFYGGPVSAPFVLVDPHAVTAQSLLVVSDSYGVNQAVSLGAVFRRVTQTTTPDRDAAGLLRTVAELVPFDRVVLVFNETNFAEVERFADLLPSAN